MADTQIVMFPDKQTARYQRLREIYGTNTNIQQSSIYLEKVIGSNDISTLFTLKNGTRPMERLFQLTENDCMLVTHMAIGLYKEPVFATNPNFARGGNVPTVYFPDPNIFTQTATANNVSEASALESAYKGWISMKANTYEVYNRLDTQRFRKVPRTQTTATTENSYYGFQYEELPNPVLFAGGDTNEISFNAAPGADMLQANGNTTTGINVLQIQMLVYLIRNADQKATAQLLMEMGQLARK